jgi:hypothetical protein
LKIPYRIHLAGVVGILAATAYAVSKLNRCIVPNLATGAKITLSSRSGESPDPQKLIDGDAFQVGFQTDKAALSWAQLELVAPVKVETITIYNRVDCCEERAVPLNVKVSTDGTHFTSVAFFEKPFARKDIALHGRGVGFVRFESTSGNFFHLDEVEVR